MSAMRFSKSTPDSMAPSTSSLAPNTPSKSLNFSDRSSKDALVGRVLPIEEVHHHDVVLLAVAVAAADALLDALGIPRQVVIHDQRAELEVDALRAGFGGDHDAAFLAEIIHKRGAHVGGPGAGDAVGALMASPASPRKSVWSGRRCWSR